MFATQEAFPNSLPLPESAHMQRMEYITHNPGILPFKTLAPHHPPSITLPHRPRLDEVGRRDSRWQWRQEDEESEFSSLVDSGLASSVSLLNVLLQQTRGYDGQDEAGVWIDIIRTFLSERGSRTVIIHPNGGSSSSSKPNLPTLSSLIHNTPEDGPCLVLACRIPSSPFFFSSSSSSSSSSPPSSSSATPSPQKHHRQTTTTAALISTFTLLHTYASRHRLPGTIVLVAVSESDDEGRKTENLKALLHRDGRKGLFRGDCVLVCPPFPCPRAGHGRVVGSSVDGRAARAEKRRGGLASGKNGEGVAQRVSHPLQRALAGRASRFLDGIAGVDMASNRDTATGTGTGGKSWCGEWSKLGIPVVELNLSSDAGVVDPAAAAIAEEDPEVELEIFVRLVKVLSFGIWDYMRAF